MGERRTEGGWGFIVGDCRVNSDSPDGDGHQVWDLIYAETMSIAPPEDNTWNKLRPLLLMAANYCIENRLKTPLGKPIETFMQLERESFHITTMIYPLVCRRVAISREIRRLPD